MGDSQQTNSEPFGQGLMFLVLTTGGMVVFALCVIVPPTEQRVRLARELVRLKRTVALLEAEVARGKYVIDELKTNPVHMKRLAIAQGYQPDDQSRVPVLPDPLPEPIPPRRLSGRRPPDLRVIPDGPDPTTALPWREAFLDPDRRRAMLVIAAAMVVLAFVLGSRSGPGPMPGRSDPARLIEP